MLKEQFASVIQEVIELVAARRGEYWEYMLQPRKQDIKRAIISHPALTLIGDGAFSCVCLHKDYPEVALKVSWRQDDSWLIYAATQDHYASDHFPKIHFVQRFQDTMYFAAMELLKPIVHEHYVDGEWHHDSYANDEIDIAVEPLIHNLHQAIKHHKSALRLMTYLKDEHCWERAMRKKYFHFIRDSLAITDYMMSAYNVKPDIHDGNIMMRNDGTPVLTDPVY